MHGQGPGQGSNRNTGCLSGNSDSGCLGERRLGGSERVFMQVLNQQKDLDPTTETQTSHNAKLLQNLYRAPCGLHVGRYRAT